LKKEIGIQGQRNDFLIEKKNIVESKLKNGDAIRVDLLNIQAQVDIEINRKVDLQNPCRNKLILLELRKQVIRLQEDGILILTWPVNTPRMH